MKKVMILKTIKHKFINKFLRSRHIRSIPSVTTSYTKQCTGKALFFEWGVEGVEYENGAATCSTAIVMMPNGEVKNIFVENIKFIIPKEK